MHSKNKVLKELNHLYKKAIEKENLNIAFKVIELRTKIEDSLQIKPQPFSLKNLSDAELESIIQELQDQYPKK